MCQDYVSRKERGRGLVGIEDSLDVPIRGREDYFKESKERLITAASNSSDDIKINRTTIKTRQQKGEEKQPYGYLKRQTGETSLVKTWTWLLKEALIEELILF